MVESSNLRLLWSKLQTPLILIVGALALGVVGYSLLFPEASFEQVLFMTGITLSTVGYGDVLGVENNSAALYFTMLLMLIGMGAVLYAISNITAFMVEGHMTHIFANEKMRRRLRKMQDHYIVCGCGTTGIHVIQEMHETQTNYIAIDSSLERIEKVKELIPDCLIIQDDATDDRFFEQVNLESAKGLIAVLPCDKDNLYLCLSAKMRNPDIKIVARTIDMNMSQKFKQVGADYVVSPNYIGGMRIASEILRPHVVTFLDKMLSAKDETIRVEESTVPKNSRFIDKSILDIGFFEETGVNILAHSTDGASYSYNPSPHYKFQGGETILYICNGEQKRRVDAFLKPPPSIAEAS